MNHIYFRPLFLPGTTDKLTHEQLTEMVTRRQRIIRDHAQHKAVRAIAEMLDLQAARLTMQALETEVTNREHAVGQAYGVGYVTSVLQRIMEAEPENEEPSDED
jgi:type III secretory pathway component EscV